MTNLRARQKKILKYLKLDKGNFSIHAVRSSFFRKKNNTDNFRFCKRFPLLNCEILYWQQIERNSQRTCKKRLEDIETS